MDGTSYIAPAVKQTEEHDLTTPRGRLLYLRDVVVPGIPEAELRMEVTDCGTAACMGGWAARNAAFRYLGIGRNRARGFSSIGWDEFFGLTDKQGVHLFIIHSYPGCQSRGEVLRQPTHAELTAHINDVLEGRIP